MATTTLFCTTTNRNAKLKPKVGIFQNGNVMDFILKFTGNWPNITYVSFMTTKEGDKKLYTIAWVEINEIVDKIFITTDHITLLFDTGKLMK